MHSLFQASVVHILHKSFLLAVLIQSPRCPPKDALYHLLPSTSKVSDQTARMRRLIRDFAGTG